MGKLAPGGITSILPSFPLERNHKRRLNIYVGAGVESILCTKERRVGHLAACCESGYIRLIVPACELCAMAVKAAA